MEAGNEFPWIFFSPPVPNISSNLRFVFDSSSSSRNMLMAVEICGVYPTNQAERLPSVVPVLPAASRPSRRAGLPVPFSTTFFRTSVTLSAMAALKARLGRFLCWKTTSPSRLTSVTEYVSFCRPLVANVE